MIAPHIPIPTFTHVQANKKFRRTQKREFQELFKDSWSRIVTEIKVNTTLSREWDVLSISQAQCHQVFQRNRWSLIHYDGTITPSDEGI